MRRALTLAAWVAACGGVAVSACTGDRGDPGIPGAPGTAGAAGAPGAAGPPGESPDAAVTVIPPAVPTTLVVSPSVALIGRTTTVVVTAVGADVDFKTNAPSIGFGSDVTVTNVEILNSHSVAADIVPSRKAVVGYRTITVSMSGTAADGGPNPELQAPSGFRIAAPLHVTAGSGSVPQGGRVVVTLSDRDAIPFDPNSVALLNTTGLCDQGALGVFQLFAQIATPTTPPPPFAASTLYGDIAGPAAARFTAIVDPLAPAGGLSVEVGNFTLATGTADTLFDSDPNDLNVTARTPIVITPGTDLTNQVPAGPLDTIMYSLTPAIGSLVSLQVKPTGTVSQPGYALTDHTGQMSRLLTFAGLGQLLGYPLPSMLLPADNKTGTLFFVVADALERADTVDHIGWTVSATSITATAAAEQGTSHAVGSPQVFNTAGPSNTGFVVSGAIASSGPLETDVYQFNLATAARLQVAVNRVYNMGTVDVSTAPDFSSNVTTLPAFPMGNLHTQGNTPGTATTWYVRITGDTATSYTLGVNPF